MLCGGITNTGLGICSRYNCVATYCLSGSISSPTYPFPSSKMSIVNSRSKYKI